MIDGARLDQILRVLTLPLAALSWRPLRSSPSLLAWDEFFYAPALQPPTSAPRPSRSPSPTSPAAVFRITG